MSVLDGFVPREKPLTKRNKSKWRCSEIVDAFLESGNKCMGKRYGTDADVVSRAFRAHLNTHKHKPVGVRKGGDMVMLVRKDVG